MRRMLDPKEVGGGGEQYCHFVEVAPKDGGEIYFNYYSTDKTKLTKETIVKAIEGKALICGGYVNVKGSAKTVEYINVLRNMLSVKWIDLTTLATSTVEFSISYINDKVFPVS